MRKHSKKVKLSNLSIKDSLSIQTRVPASARLPSDYSPPSLNVRGIEGRVTSTISIEVHLTVRPLVELSRRQVSLLLEAYLIRVTQEGWDLSSYLVIEWMNSYLRGSKDPYELKEEKERLVIRLSDILLQSIRNQPTLLDQRTDIDQEVKYWITSLLDPTGRKYASRKIHYHLEKFLEVRAVPVTSIYEREGHSIRYSSYCKGYGESSRMGRRQKTRTSFELDGKEPGRQGEISLATLEIYFHLNLLEEKLRLKRA